MKSVSLPLYRFIFIVGLLAQCIALATPPGQYRLQIRPDQLKAESSNVDWTGIVDSQFDLGAPPSAEPLEAGWKFLKYPRDFPVAVVVDLGAELPLASLWIYDTHGEGELLLQAGKPGQWTDVSTYGSDEYKNWKRLPLDLETRFLRLEAREAGANFTQIAVDAYSPRGYAAYLEQQRETRRLAAEREARIRLAREEAMKRPLIEMEPYGLLSLVDEVDLAGDGSAHLFEELPEGASRVETILGRPARVLNKLENEVPVISYRLGRHKLLRPGAAYVVVVDYPEDAPRSLVIASTGNETIRGFYTGISLGDAMHPKYVDNLNESLDIPLSGQWESWSLLTHLHDRFPAIGGLRGPKVRPLAPEDGFTVSITQFTARNIPASEGAAVSRIRLFEVMNPDELKMPLQFPPADLPKRRISWREEMSDGVIQSEKEVERGIKDRLDWYRYKANRMHFLGIHTYTKDLLEFGANQSWDSSEYGGNEWVYQSTQNYLWAEIVELMGEEGFDLLPYYEYAGSRGSKGLGGEKRAKPLTRDDAFTHTAWIENSVADLTDPDTYEDFGKMLDLTVLRHLDKADFAGIWLRPRRQLPVGFGPAALVRFAKEANDGVQTTRAELIEDTALYERYIQWWDTKRRDFLVGMREHLIAGGLENPLVLFTNDAGEPGVPFLGWDRGFVTDQKDWWSPILAQPEHALADDRSYRLMSPAEVVRDGLYLEALTTPDATWGGWEWQHSQPGNDPFNYKDTEGVLLTYPMNRLYTVSSSEALDAFSGDAGLALVRHHSLNENMAHDLNDKDRLNYFVADIERAGRFSMLAEVVAMAHGNPSYIGYLVGSNFGRGFPGPVREFNANFLALPALPATVVDGASEDPEVTVKMIETESAGRYLILVHTGWHAKADVSLKLPKGKWTEVVSGNVIDASTGTTSLSFKPVQLLTLHAPETSD